MIESSAAAGSAADGVAAMAISGPAQQDAAPDSSTAEQPPVAAAPADGSQDASAAKPAGAAACNDPDRLIEVCISASHDAKAIRCQTGQAIALCFGHKACSCQCLHMCSLVLRYLILCLA